MNVDVSWFHPYRPHQAGKYSVEGRGSPGIDLPRNESRTDEVRIHGVVSNHIGRAKAAAAIETLVTPPGFYLARRAGRRLVQVNPGVLPIDLTRAAGIVTTVTRILPC
jgi:hypothetical protein